ncbi:MAG: GNAT family N-acetyltransferase [Candidatus Velthaea sp.]
MKPLRTDRLVLEPVDPRNARDLWRILGAPDLRRFQDIPRVRAEEFERQVRARPRALRPKSTGRFEWLVRRVQDQAPVGWISLRINERTPEVGEVGYSLIEEARGHGYATEAVAAVVEESFGVTEIGELQACCVPQNGASRAVLDRTGFHEVRLLKNGAMIRGRHVDVLLYALHRGEWTRERGAAASRQIGS